MDDQDDLQDFIADCEWKTRKILRESNKRMQDNARLLASKERVQKLKNKGSKITHAKNRETPSNVKNVVPSVEKTSASIIDDKITPVKEWKGRDKIIRDACETIKSFPDETNPLKGARAATSARSKVGKDVHSSLQSSPFLAANKGNKDGSTVEKYKTRHVNHHDDSDDDGHPAKCQPAMVTRRTIERDFYIMSKKRNKPPSKRRHRTKNDKESTPELKSSVLWKKYRCDERIMKAKSKRAERLYHEFQRLKNVSDEAECLGRKESSEESDLDSSTSSEEQEYVHAIHDLVETHIADENFRVQRRTEKQIMKMHFKPDVQEMWKQLDSGGNEILPDSGTPSDGSSKASEEVLPMPVHIATEQSDASPRENPEEARRKSQRENHDTENASGKRTTHNSHGPSTVCPGHAAFGERGVWRLFEPIADDTEVEIDCLGPLWPSSKEIKYPTEFDKTQASSYFFYKDHGSHHEPGVAVLTSLAFESPILAPDCFAKVEGFIVPPFSEHELVRGNIPHVNLPCSNLLENPVKSRLDTFLPRPVVVLDSGESKKDWENAPTNGCGNFYHQRDVAEYDLNGFRVKAFANKVEYDNTIPSVIYGISDKEAMPNRPELAPILTHASKESCTQSLSRERTAADYHGIAESNGEGTLNEPCLFLTHMSAYKSVFVSRISTSAYRKQESDLIAIKQAERKRREIALKMKAAEEIVEARLKERLARIEGSVQDQITTKLRGIDNSLRKSATEEHVDGDEDDSAVNLPSDVYDLATECRDSQVKVACDVELPDPRIESLSKDEGNEIEQLAIALLKNKQFLNAVARKLQISEASAVHMDSPRLIPNDADGKLNPSQLLHRKSEVENSCLDKTTPSSRSKVRAIENPMDPDPQSLPKLKLNCNRYRESNCSAMRGDGWKRLPRSETIIGELKLTNRRVQKGWGGPKFNIVEGKREFISVNAADEIHYKTDPRHFAVKTTSMFIPDLSLERLRLSKSLRQQKVYEESILTSSQKRDLDEILQIPVSSSLPQKLDDVNYEKVVEENDEHNYSAPKETRKIDHVQGAILAVKNHNLPELEQILDVEGVPVETRDQHGNTLFILASQGGSKRLVKFLLRRGADMNAQNNVGNTALHFLNEYGHTTLAEYLLRKGADDSIRNSEGLTVYEGVHLTSLYNSYT